MNIPFGLEGAISAFLTYPLYRILFFITMFESSPLFGMIVPGQLFIMLGGFLGEYGFLNVTYVLVFAIIAAILGDIIAYILGRTYGPKLILRFGKYLLITREHYLATEHSLINYPLRTLALGRFSAATRALAYFVAGTRHIKVHRWIGLSIISSCIWAIFYCFAGYFFAHTYKELLGTIDILAALGLGIVLLFIIQGYRTHKEN